MNQEVLRFFVLVVGLVVIVNGAGRLNDKCRLRDDCNKFGYYCARNFTCQCIGNMYVPNNYGDKCVGIIGADCDYDEDCIAGAYCKNQMKCFCKKDFIPNADNTECSIASFSKATLVVPSMVFIGLILLGLG